MRSRSGRTSCPVESCPRWCSSMRSDGGFRVRSEARSRVSRRASRRSSTAGSSIRTTPVRQSFEAGRCRTCSCPAITDGSWSGGESKVGQGPRLRNPIDVLHARLAAPVADCHRLGITILGAVAIVLAIKAYVVNQQYDEVSRGDCCCPGCSGAPRCTRCHGRTRSRARDRRPPRTAPRRGRRCASRALDQRRIVRIARVRPRGQRVLHLAEAHERWVVNTGRDVRELAVAAQPGGEPVDRRAPWRRACRSLQASDSARSPPARRRPSADRRQRARPAPRAAGCWSWSSPCRCAGTSRTRSGRTLRRSRLEAARATAAERLRLLDGVQQERRARIARSRRPSRRARRARAATAGSSSAFVRVSPTHRSSVAVGGHQRERRPSGRPARGTPAPVPWVPVEVAPAIVCRSMSPRFSMASAVRPSRAGSWYSLVPAASVRGPARRVHGEQPVESGEVQQHARRDARCR